jgi:hypothetical protein
MKHRKPPRPCVRAKVGCPVERPGNCRHWMEELGGCTVCRVSIEAKNREKLRQDSLRKV